MWNLFSISISLFRAVAFSTVPPPFLAPSACHFMHPITLPFPQFIFLFPQLPHSLFIPLYRIHFIKMYPSPLLALFRSGGHDKGPHHQADSNGSGASRSPDWVERLGRRRRGRGTWRRLGMWERRRRGLGGRAAGGWTILLSNDGWNQGGSLRCRWDTPTHLNEEKQEVVSGDEVMLRTPLGTVSHSISFVQRELQQKSISLKTSHHGDSNPVHLFNFRLFVTVVHMVTNSRCRLPRKAPWNVFLALFCFTGVAEQFALAEASMHVWSLNDNIDQPSTSLQGRPWKRRTCVSMGPLFKGV